ncbi:MafI family immunity protein [Phytomonospora sp. NPDC050363]|uniref:MafI family immunity protein n=1 Tax=Phytomonospora sp. NPDC050363 TaxID=3155642 RepID=UPI0033E41DE9
MDVREITRALEALLDSLSGRVDAAEIDMSRDDLDAGEWRLAFEALLAALAAERVAVTEAERADLLRLAADLDIDPAPVGELPERPAAQEDPAL